MILRSYVKISGSTPQGTNGNGPSPIDQNEVWHNMAYNDLYIYNYVIKPVHIVYRGFAHEIWYYDALWGCETLHFDDQRVSRNNRASVASQSAGRNTVFLEFTLEQLVCERFLR